MKLTKQKLEQLITEEYVRRIGDEGKPTNYPEYADKLTALAKTDPAQARELADALDEPLDIEFSGNTSATFRHPSVGGVFNFEEMKQETWFDYVMTGYADNFEDPIDPNQFEKYANDKGISQDKKQKVYNKLESERSKLLQKLYINQSRTDVERRKELEDLYGFDFRPDWMKKSHYN
tara:strand:- start:29 stop:559 length:531 start_codon:yes stop_codon:yes gene_type:complete